MNRFKKKINYGYADVQELMMMKEYIPVPLGGVEPAYSVKISPWAASDPGMLATIQCCHSRNFGLARLGASGSTEITSLKSLNKYLACKCIIKLMFINVNME